MRLFIAMCMEAAYLDSRCFFIVTSGVDKECKGMHGNDNFTQFLKENHAHTEILSQNLGQPEKYQVKKKYQNLFFIFYFILI
jgi:hypothetical protein